MAKKSKKPKAAKVSTKAQLRAVTTRARTVFAGHGVVIMFLIAGGSIGFALVRARSYLNPARDEERFTAATSKNKYSKIDYTLVNKLELSLNRAPIDVSQSLAPNRKNPFSE